MSLRDGLLKLANEHPELRQHLLPLLQSKQGAGLATVEYKGRTYKIQQEVADVPA